MIASGLPRFSSRHHWLSGSTMAMVPRLLVQTGIWLCAFNCMLRAELARVLLVCAAAGEESTRSAAEAASAEANLSMFTPWIERDPYHFCGGRARRC